MAFSQSMVDWLNVKVHDTIHLRNEGLQTLSDIEIYNKAKQENRIILTCDLNFATILAFSKSIIPSIIIFRLSNELLKNRKIPLPEITRGILHR